eukprot:TRINITY_DN2467_c0_g1_i3.p1 TRINITY_DN2467_c0_g1~~TRINITY_DN2467_c0_g1_i3.p1  ORF type:complete len:305 (+),score=88.40 TRINITY_DN2467_c0_g1_i3:1-915(+)
MSTKQKRKSISRRKSRRSSIYYVEEPAVPQQSSIDTLKQLSFNFIQRGKNIGYWTIIAPTAKVLSCVLNTAIKTKQVVSTVVSKCKDGCQKVLVFTKLRSLTTTEDPKVIMMNRKLRRMKKEITALRKENKGYNTVLKDLQTDWQQTLSALQTRTPRLNSLPAPAPAAFNKPVVEEKAAPPPPPPPPAPPVLAPRTPSTPRVAPKSTRKLDPNQPSFAVTLYAIQSVKLKKVDRPERGSKSGRSPAKSPVALPVKQLRAHYDKENLQNHVAAPSSATATQAPFKVTLRKVDTPTRTQLAPLTQQ